MEEIIKYLEEIKKHQMQTVQLARSTEVYKLADKALAKALFIQGVVKSFYCASDGDYRYDRCKNQCSHCKKIE